MTFVTASFISSISHNDSLWAKGKTKSHREKGLDYREAEELSWCPSMSNSLWRGWSCGLVHCPAGNATDPIWRVMTSSDGISSWTPLKSQHSNPNPLANQLWCIDCLTPPTPLIIPHRLLAFLWISYATQKLMLNSCKMVEKQSEAFNTFLWHHFLKSLNRILLHMVLLKCPHVQISFLKFTTIRWQPGFSRMYSNSSCRCSFEPEIIKIGQSSHKMYSNNILNFQVYTTILNAVQKSLETYWMHHVCSMVNVWKNSLNSLDINWLPLSETRQSRTPNWANYSCKKLVTTSVFAFFI